MNTFHTNQGWFDNLLPEGLPIPSSTLLSGPGGSGKPLVGDVMIAAWLRQGGSVVFMSLQYPDYSFIVAGLKNVAGLELADYEKQSVFIELDATLEGMTEPEGNHFKANLAKPKIWDASLTQACSMLPSNGLGVLIFGSALNLLLFSPTYGADILEKMKETAQNTEKHSYLFSASTTAKGEEIAELEAVVDHLIMTRSTKQPFRLFMQIERIKNAPFKPEEIEVPISENTLHNVKAIAEHSRQRVIPLISKL